mgnify:FL=1
MINLLETKRIKEEIEKKPADYLNIIEKASMGICITNAEGMFVAVNENYTKIYGYKREELIGTHFSIVVPDGNKEYLKKLHDEFMKNKFEILRNWEVKKRSGEIMKISADAGYSEKINGKPHKITFVQPD